MNPTNQETRAYIIHTTKEALDFYAKETNHLPLYAAQPLDVDALRIVL